MFAQVIGVGIDCGFPSMCVCGFGFPRVGVCESEDFICVRIAVNKVWVSRGEGLDLLYGLFGCL